MSVVQSHRGVAIVMATPIIVNIGFLAFNTL